MDHKLFSRVYLGAFFILIASLFYYQILKGDYYLERAKNNYLRVIPLSSVRGSIFDRNGYLLAYDKPLFNIAVIPYQIRKIKTSLFRKLAKDLQLPLKSIESSYKKGLTNIFTPVDIVLGLDKLTALTLKEKFGSSILIDPKPQRFYPFAYEFAHLLGYVKEAASFYEKLKRYGYAPKERAGFLGIEQYYDSYLKGEDGGDLIEVSAGGRTVGFLGKRTPQRGKNIYLTVDLRIQKAADEALGIRKGAIILMDSKSGEIIALVSAPSFDLNKFVKGEKVAKFLNSRRSPMINRAIQATYPLGSTFKPIVAAGGLEEEKITAATIFFCAGKINVGGEEFLCWKKHGNQNLYQALAHSCNVYFYNLGLILGGETIAKWAEEFGLGSFTEVDLPYEKKGTVPHPAEREKTFKKHWFSGDTINLSIGQGYIEASPLEMLLAINIFANGGYLVKPYLLKEVADIDTRLAARRRIKVSEDNLEIVKRGLIGVVEEEDGTGHILSELNLKVAGKTGTAQARGRSHAWFVGFLPYDNPRYTFSIFLENGGSSIHALRVAYVFLKKLKERNLL